MKMHIIMLGLDICCKFCDYIKTVIRIFDITY
jgi:hypothetical protein